MRKCFVNYCRNQWSKMFTVNGNKQLYLCYYHAMIYETHKFELDYYQGQVNAYESLTPKRK